MTKKTIQFSELDPEDFKNEIVSDLMGKLVDQYESWKRPKSTDYLTRKEVAAMFKVDISTVHNWTKQGTLKAFGIGGRVYYLRSEIEQALIPLKNNPPKTY